MGFKDMTQDQISKYIDIYDRNVSDGFNLSSPICAIGGCFIL